MRRPRSPRGSRGSPAGEPSTPMTTAWSRSFSATSRITATGTVTRRVSSAALDPRSTCGFAVCPEAPSTSRDASAASFVRSSIASPVRASPWTSSLGCDLTAACDGGADHRGRCACRVCPGSWTDGGTRSSSSSGSGHRMTWASRRGRPLLAASVIGPRQRRAGGRGSVVRDEDRWTGCAVRDVHRHGCTMTRRAAARGRRTARSRAPEDPLLGPSALPSGSGARESGRRRGLR